MSKTKIMVLGGVSYDTILHVDSFPRPIPHTYIHDSYHETVGSAGSGKALNLNMLGFDVKLHGTIGNDIYGNFIKDYFDKYELKFNYDYVPKGTQRNVNMMDQDGGRISYMMNLTYEPEVDWNKLDRKIEKSDHVVINTLNYCRKAIPIAKKYGKPIWTDLNDYDGKNDYLRDFIEAADYILFCSDNLEDYRSFMQTVMDKGKKLIVCTHGINGSTALTQDGRWIETPALEGFTVLDSSGVGDSFFSGLLYGIVRGYPIETSLKMGTVLSALCLQSHELFNTDLSEKKFLKAYSEFYKENL